MFEFSFIVYTFWKNILSNKLNLFWKRTLFLHWYTSFFFRNPALPTLVQIRRHITNYQNLKIKWNQWSNTTLRTLLNMVIISKHVYRQLVHSLQQLAQPLQRHPRPVKIQNTSYQTSDSPAEMHKVELFGQRSTSLINLEKEFDDTLHASSNHDSTTHSQFVYCFNWNLQQIV